MWLRLQVGEPTLVDPQVVSATSVLQDATKAMMGTPLTRTLYNQAEKRERWLRPAGSRAPPTSRQSRSRRFGRRRRRNYWTNPRATAPAADATARVWVQRVWVLQDWALRLLLPPKIPTS